MPSHPQQVASTPFGPTASHSLVFSGVRIQHDSTGWRVYRLWTLWCFILALWKLQNSTNAKSARAAEALLDVTGKLKAAEQSLKAEDEVQLLACFGVFESHRINYWSFICFILSHRAWRLHESCSIAMARLWCRWRKRRESFCVDFERSFGVSKVKLWATQRLPDPEESLKSLFKGIICQIYIYIIYTYNMIYIYYNIIYILYIILYI